jgi:tetratricopeptide (TPR) repeat protein
MNPFSRRIGAVVVALVLMSSLALGQTARELWESLDRRGDQPRAQHEESLALHRQALALAEQQSSADFGSAQWPHAVWRSSEKVGRLLAELGRHQEALVVFQQGLEVALQLERTEPTRAEWQRAIAMFWLAIGDELAELKRPLEALRAFRDALAVSEKLALTRSGPEGLRRSVMTAQSRIGGVLWQQGDLAGALGAYQAARTIARNRAMPGDPASQDDLAEADEAVATTLIALGSFAEALDVLQESLAIRERLRAEKPDASRGYDLSVAQELLGKALLGQGNPDRSLKAFETSLSLRQAAIAVDPANPMWEIATANSYGHVGMVLAQLGRRQEARDSLQKGRAILVRQGADATWFDGEISRLE